MKRNKFIEKMALKTDSELETIFENKDKYTGDAIQAVIWELEKRKRIPESDFTFSEKVFDMVPSEKKTEPIEFDQNASTFDEFELPILYSKKTIQGFTIFFSTIFGAVLLMYNLKEMSKPKARNQVLAFGILYTILIYVVVITIINNFFVTIILNLIGYGILTEFFWKKHLESNLKYKKKEITKPLIIALLITGFLVFLSFLPIILA